MSIKNAKILVVDDDRQTADNLVESLRSLGYEATAAYGGLAGLSRFERGDFHLVITDLNMPEMDGLELLERIKSLDRRAIVMVITGYGTIASAVDAIKKGAYDFLPKPFKVEELEVVIHRALDRRSLKRQLLVFRGLTLALMISIPLWLVLGILLAMAWK